MTKRVPPEKRKKRGRPEFVPTQDQIGQVNSCLMANFRKDAIARLIGVDEKTLDKHFKEQLETAKYKLIVKATNQVAAGIDRGEAWATCFYLKTQGKEFGWSERHEHTGKDGAPLLPAEMTDEQLDDYIARLRKRGVSGRAPRRKK